MYRDSTLRESCPAFDEPARRRPATGLPHPLRFRPSAAADCRDGRSARDRLPRTLSHRLAGSAAPDRGLPPSHLLTVWTAGRCPRVAKPLNTALALARQSWRALSAGLAAGLPWPRGGQVGWRPAMAAKLLYPREIYGNALTAQAD